MTDNPSDQSAETHREDGEPDQGRHKTEDATDLGHNELAEVEE